MMHFVKLLPLCTLSFLLFPHPHVLVAARPPAYSPSSSASGTNTAAKSAPVCRNEVYSPFDYSAKIRGDENAPVCPVEIQIETVLPRQLTNDDFSCSESKPCSNGACCSKKTGFCNYGPEACGTNGRSPNDVCWSNCNAHAECGRNALIPGTECPLKVCCSLWGFCGMTSGFCAKTSDPTTSCQSNCDQPGSGSTGGDVQSRIIGYYAAWAHDQSCYGMDFQNIPVGGLTHLHFSFGYITPGDFKVAPMDGLDVSLFSKLTDMKKRNSGLKAIIALGGWTFNDPGSTQTVFSNIVSSAANRATFITNLLAFLREYAFDGVDFDWEYPGAPDRGGQPTDGINFTQFLSELRSAIARQPIQYVVSFTVPTSYWYLRWFDLKAINYVDWVNVMSYDLHGTWDSTNPIGNRVLAHTNLTEIKEAFDLFWRNSVPANKLNLGLGFYGRSFQLSDPACYKPGCNFKGGAAPGACTKNSGTLSFKEITQIIDQFKLTPYYDGVNGVKYIVWNQDQWVSYDDEVTFKQKIDFANNLGLGGLLIWSVDQDTADLRALKGVLAPKSINAFASQANDASYWQDATVADCYVSDCGASCKGGFIPITHQPCGNAKPVTRHSDHPDSNLCCPLTAAPDPSKCTWRGNPISCNGHCENGEVAVELNRWGGGGFYCEDGNKAYCCQVPAATENKCYWSGVGKKCNAGDEPLTFSGSFLQAVANVLDFFPPTLIGEALEAAINLFRIDLLNRYCCPPDDLAKWTNCNWHGQPGSCFDNHCDIGHQVQLTQSEYGLGQTCWPRLERQRVFCCDPAGGKSPFLPVPLENLFPHPPTGKTVDSVYDLRVDNTWGTGQADTPDEQPNEASFGFVVLTSPETLQISLKKRDGTHWEVFNCNDAVSEEEQTVKMFCTDISESSNCHKITLGHGVPGTILEMPEGCGPSKYAVAKSMVPSAAQSLPKHLEKRDYGHKPVIYDLTFDFDWHRVPRDLGDTQMRVDFSNEIGYWDAIVNKAASKKSKRSLEDAGGNHRRWLEEEWREDVHFGRLSHDELHARWFGSDIIAWLKKFFSPEIKPQFTHNIDSSFTAKLIDETWDCNIKGVDLHAKLLAEALAHVKVATSFGLTIITTLKLPLDLSQSYLYFKNKGDISATFILDAFGKAIFQTGDIELLGLQNFPGATFSIPKLLTVGPNFRLFGAVDAEVTLSAHLESKVQIASWEVQQTYPDQGPDWDPKAVSPPDRTGTGSFDGLTQPSFDYSVTATGQITAHLKPTFEFGITFDQIWGVGAAKADVVADGWVRFMGAAGIGSSGNCPFTYGIDVGADLYAKVEAPPAFGWNPRTFPIASISPKSAKPGGSCPAQRKRNTFEISASPQIGTETMNNNRPAHHLLGKRAPTVGPLISLPKSCFFCPGAPVGGAACETIEGWEPNEINQPDLTSKRDLSGDTHYNIFEKRAKKTIDFCQARPASLSAKMQMVSPPYDSSGVIVGKLPNIATYGYTNPTDCNDYGFGLVAKPVPKVNTNKFATEHILEYQLLSIFFDETRNQEGSVFNDLRPSAPGTLPQIVNLCQYLKSYFDLPVPLWPNIGGVTRSPIQWLSYQYPGSDNAFTEEFVILDKGVNNAKEKMWGSDRISADSKMQEYLRGNPEKAAKNVKDVLSAYKYHQFPDVNTILVAQAMRIANMLENLDNNLLPPIHRADSNGNLYSPYRPIGLRNLWMNWIRGRTEAARIKAETHMRDVVSKLQAGYATPELRNSATPQEQEFITRIDSLATAVNAALANPWFNPF